MTAFAQKSARAVLVVCLTLLAFASQVYAVQPDEVLSDPALEKRARSLSAGLRCVVCQNQSIDDSDAPLAGDLRRLVRERLVAGDTDDEVMSNVVARYGEYVLLKPRFGAHTAVLWLLPFAVLGFAILFMIRTRRTAKPVEPASSGIAPQVLSDDEEQRLADLLEGASGRDLSKE